MSDRLQIEILPDGTIRTMTDRISSANHQSADQFLRDVAVLTGGKVTRQAKPQTAGVSVERKAEQG
jgi:hypothetical protein